MAEHEEYREHFQRFKEFLGPNELNDKGGARDKLTKLSNNQFKELEKDVFDELVRRTDDVYPYLPINEMYHPKRNQARQKLSSLQVNRFKELLSDIYHELMKRNPEIYAELNKKMDKQAQPDRPNHLHKSETRTAGKAANQGLSESNENLAEQIANLKYMLEEKDQEIMNILQQNEDVLSALIRMRE